MSVFDDLFTMEDLTDMGESLYCTKTVPRTYMGAKAAVLHDHLNEKTKQFDNTCVDYDATVRRLCLQNSNTVRS